jgi:myosin heavy subunit
MEIDSSVWAKKTFEGNWFRASVTRTEELLAKKKGDLPLVKFTLALKNDKGEATGAVETVESARSEPDANDFEFVKLRNSADLNVADIEDLTILQHLHEPSILECLQARYEKDIIYTNTGSILVALNPFKDIPIYGVKKTLEYMEAGINSRFSEDVTTPHVYKVADRAYRNMVEYAECYRYDDCNQSVLVSGESGAGEIVS